MSFKSCVFINIVLQILVTRSFPKDEVSRPDAALFHLAMSACPWDHALRLFERMEEAAGIGDAAEDVWLFFFVMFLVGGLEHDFYFPIYWE